MHFSLAVLLIIFIVLFGLIPFFLIYPLSDFIGFLIYRVIGYRKNVIQDNIKNCFPEKSQSEIKELLSSIYKNLADIIIEGIKSFTMTRGQIMRRHKILNPELVNKYIKNGQSVVAVTAHYNNWEWGSLSASLQLDMNAIGFYKPLSNHYIDRFLKWSRSRYGTTLVSIYETTATFEQFVNQSKIFLMAADQNPSNPEKAYWIDFFGKKTAFLHGPEKHARQNNLPIVFIEIMRVKRGFYTIQLSDLVKNPMQYQEGEITQLYAKKIEEVIRRDPPNWLWSHKRWKHQPKDIGI